MISHLQQDVFSIFSKQLMARITKDPVGWASNERINDVFQSAIQQLQDGNMVPPTCRQIGELLQIRIDAKQLSSHLIARRIDLSSIKCLYFTLSAPQPLRVLFSSSILQKYSRISVLLVQVKAAECAILKVCSPILTSNDPRLSLKPSTAECTQFKRGIRCRACFAQYV